ncbi:hypothetical protein [Xanthomonas hortorum]|uniref:hypothetical protein n=1 Tax=Xanthomonas hortorum TaxID=56454 RepID=UPI002113FCDF|nr:hypothetical protein [Xanthomonas hortorum]UUF04416.1 hypothetical protein NDY25_11040 [Xanthomonas hortorum pv. pelargonii]
MLLKMQGMAHTLLDTIGPILNNEALHAEHKSALKLLTRMSERALGKRAVGGSDDIAEEIKQIQNRIAAHYANPAQPRGLAMASSNTQATPCSNRCGNSRRMSTSKSGWPRQGAMKSSCSSVGA